MATTSMATAFKSDLAKGIHNFTNSTGNAYSILLIKASPSFQFGANQTNVGTPGTGIPSTTNVGTDEVTGDGYTAGGYSWSTSQNITPNITGTTAFWSWTSNPNWNNATFSASAAIIYLKSTGNVVAIFDFSGVQTVTNGTFTLILPSNNFNTAILRIA